MQATRSELAFLVEQLDSEDPRENSRAESRLRSLGPEALPALAERDQDLNTQEARLFALHVALPIARDHDPAFEIGRMGLDDGTTPSGGEPVACWPTRFARRLPETAMGGCTIRRDETRRGCHAAIRAIRR